MAGLIPELQVLGIRITVLILKVKAHPAKRHLEVEDEMVSLIRERFPFVIVKSIAVGDGAPDHVQASAAGAIFFSLSPPDVLHSFSPSRNVPWIQIQHADDLFETSGKAKKKADGFLLLGKKWVSDEIRSDRILSSLSRTSIEYVKSKPASFPGHLGLNPGWSESGQALSSSPVRPADVLLFDHAIRLRGRSAARSFLKTTLVCVQHGPELGNLRSTFKIIGRGLCNEGMSLAIRPRLKGLPLPLGYPKDARRNSVGVGDDDPSAQILASNGVISFYPSFAILEALFLGRPVLAVDWWGLIHPDSGIHSSPQRVMWSELQDRACPGFRIANQNLGEISLRAFFSQSDFLGDFDIDGWISPATRRREEIDRLLFEVGKQR